MVALFTLLAIFLVRGLFLSDFQVLGVKCGEMGFKNPPNVFYSKGAVMNAKCSTQKKSLLGLKSSERAFCFQWQGFIDRVEKRSVNNCSQPSRAKYSAKVFKEVNSQNSSWSTREVIRVIDHNQFKRGVIS